MNLTFKPNSDDCKEAGDCYIDEHGFICVYDGIWSFYEIDPVDYTGEVEFTNVPFIDPLKEYHFGLSPEDYLDILNNFPPFEGDFVPLLPNGPLEVKKSRLKVCECGSEKCGLPTHSSWCPMNGVK